MKIKEEVDLLVAEFKEANTIDLLELQGGYSDYDMQTLTELRKIIKEDSNFILEKEDLEVLALEAEFCINWIAKGEEKETFGGFNFSGLPAAVSMDKYRMKLYNEDVEEPEKSLIKQSGYFDVMSGLEYKAATVVIVNKSLKELEFWYIDGVEMTRINLSVSAYFEALFLTKGMYHWQYLFCDPKIRNKIR